MLANHKFVIIHGSYGSPDENWFPWLDEQLSKHGASVIRPSLPTPEHQSLENWCYLFKKQIGPLDSQAVLIGHSLAVPFILRILEATTAPIKAAFLVSGFIRLLGIDEFDQVNKTFVEGEFNWEKIKSNASRFFVYHSDNDPYVPLEFGKEIADQVGAEFIVIHNGGHINASSGFTEFHDVLRDIEQVCGTG